MKNYQSPRIEKIVKATEFAREAMYAANVSAD